MQWIALVDVYDNRLICKCKCAYMYARAVNCSILCHTVITSQVLLPGEFHKSKQIGAILRDIFLSAYISKSSTHPPMKIHTGICDTSNGMMWAFGVDQANSHWLVNKLFGVKIIWSCIKSRLTHQNLRSISVPKGDDSYSSVCRAINFKRF